MPDDEGIDGTEGQDGTEGTEGQSTTDTGDGGSSKTFTQEDLDRAIESRLARERKKFADYDELKKKASAADKATKAAQTTEEKLEQLRSDLAERDAAQVQERADQASDKLHAKLIRGGLTDEDATALVGTIDPLRLLEDGKPSSAEIDKLAKTLTKIGTRQQPDPDQGRQGGTAAPSMNQMIREAAGRTRV